MKMFHVYVLHIDEETIKILRALLLPYTVLNYIVHFQFSSGRVDLGWGSYGRSMEMMMMMVVGLIYGQSEIYWLTRCSYSSYSHSYFCFVFLSCFLATVVVVRFTAMQYIHECTYFMPVAFFAFLLLMVYRDIVALRLRII